MKRLRRHLAVFAFLVLLCAVANLMIAIDATQWTTRQTTRLLATRRVPVTSDTPWPGPIPETSAPWPAVTMLDLGERFAVQHWDARSVTENQSTHSMEVSKLGWPLPVLTSRQYWWPWDDPQWGPQDRDEARLRFLWSGVILNPLIGASAIWLVLFGPFVLVGLVTRFRRRREGRCVACGYRVGNAGVCPECGEWMQPSK